jgi:acyl carrier protein
MRDTIRQFLSDRYLITFDANVDDDSDLFQLGFIDSYGYIELIRFLEKEFNLVVSDEEMLTNVLVTCSSIVAYVERKLQLAKMASAAEAS